ncbi:hypothetical protein PYW07_002928 [Mythimna separata]|uniref:DUF4476 domain-containing protein n=1 Tax=Mythimna separata TaxID=271217 RepID=A0AAD7YHA2_MYTSE|nr:hypothetical protein PYW07_002928 [Mythimna separata]
MKVSIFIIIISIVFCFNEVKSDSNETVTARLYKDDDVAGFKVLSRRKRFLIFPDGSSFQIVFCNQNHGYLQIGNIVWFGVTAAMAWELPTDPGDFDMFRDQIKVFDGKRRSDTLYYVDEDGKIVDKIEYKKKFLINPAFAKRSVDAVEANVRNKAKINKKEMHSSQKNKIYFKDLDTTRLERHRQERQKLYVKLEKFLQTLGWNGKECILKMLCTTGKGQIKQNSFVGEILRAVFTLPEVPESVSKLHKQYDDARGANGDCAQLYPKCGELSVL